jgi:hypothetical protein
VWLLFTGIIELLPVELKFLKSVINCKGPPPVCLKLHSSPHLKVLFGLYSQFVIENELLVANLKTGTYGLSWWD